MGNTGATYTQLPVDLDDLEHDGQVHFYENTFHSKRLELLLDLTAKLIILIEITSVCCPAVYSACLFNLPLRDQCHIQPFLLWISHVIKLHNIRECITLILSYVLFHAPDSEHHVFML